MSACMAALSSILSNFAVLNATAMVQDINIRVSPQEAADLAALKALAARQCGLSAGDVNALAVTRRSIDARQRRVWVNLTVRVASGDDSRVALDVETPDYKDVSSAGRCIVIVGAGPAGLFAALRALELGIRPVVLERGDSVEARRLKLAQISREGTVDPDTNYSFGEGGAGAYSDGKLYTRSKKRGSVAKVLSLLCRHGASQDILIDAHPHIGSDKLPAVIRNIRETIASHGGEVHFNSRVDALAVSGGRARGVTTADGRAYRGDAVILATGHSARDVYRMLHSSGVHIEAKGLAIGVRLEHPQHLIDCLQYHSPQGRGKYLPAAEYSFVTQVRGRGVYSFCMCPGGVIVPAATSPDGLVVNGMSASARAGQWANSGMVVEVRPGDFPEYAHHGSLQLMALQEELERSFCRQSGMTLNAPAQRMTDFVRGRLSESLPRSSYAPGIHAARLDELLPPFIADRLKEGFRVFDRQRRGFLSPEAALVGLESRTSSPVRIPRRAEDMQHVEIRGLYPAGEGAGYAGGIVSAAIDGIRCVEAFAACAGQPQSSSNQ